jgi:hypothetical protein
MSVYAECVISYLWSICTAKPSQRKPAECHMQEHSSSGGEDSDWTSSSGESSADSSTDKEETHRLLILVQESIAKIYWDVDAFSRLSNTQRQKDRSNLMQSLASISDFDEV